MAQPRRRIFRGHGRNKRIKNTGAGDRPPHKTRKKMKAIMQAMSAEIDRRWREQDNALFTLWEIAPEEGKHHSHYWYWMDGHERNTN